MIRRANGFTEMPITYENAYGGIGWPDNPLGAGALAGTGEPTVFDPFDDRRHAGFGPIGVIWAARKKLLGGLSRRVLDADLVELPDDFDFAYFQSAPPDQRVPFLRGDEWIVMDGLHPTVPRFRTRLPGARGLACVYGLSPWGVAEGQPLALHADTLRIDGDEQRATLTFRGAFPVAVDDALPRLRIVAGVELPGAPIPWPALEDLPALEAAATPEPASESSESFSLTLSGEDFESVGGDVLDGTLSLGPDERPPAAVMPFRPGPASAGVTRAAPRPPESRPERIRSTLAIDDVPDFPPELPFRAPAPSPAPPPRAPSDGEGTMASAPPAAPSVSSTSPAPPAPAAPAAPAKQASGPWAPAPPEPPKAPAPPPKAPAMPSASPKLKKGLYGKFGGG